MLVRTEVRAMSDEGQMLEITAQGCMELLRGPKVGRLVYEGAGGPVIVPLNYLLEAGVLFVRTAGGADASKHRGAVVFEVDAIDEVSERGWSVIVHGVMDRADPAAVAILGDRLRPWAAGARDEWMAIGIVEVTGRWVAGARGGYRPAPEGHL
jgi:nitroimidazol reductase NimA-like FMN-containing flavoprotein (pyridoxamine 5'-phosphate oxidase superfamily)